MRKRIIALLGLGLAGPVAAQEAAVGGESAVQVLSLERALATAFENSQTLAQARYGLRVANQQVREAWGGVLPDISATASYSRNLLVQQAFLPAFIFDPNAPPDELIPVRFGSDNTWQAGLSLTQPLFQWTAFIGVGAAGRYRELERERLRGVSHAVVASVRLAYLEAMLAAEEVRLTRQSVDRVRRTLEETRGLNRAGLASDYDLLRLEVQVANLEPTLSRAENALADAKRALLVAIGQDPLTPVELEGRLNEMNVVALAQNSASHQALLRLAGYVEDDRLDADRAWQLARASRSDLRQADLAVDLERARLGAQRAEYFPKLSIFSNYSLVAQENGAPDFFGTSRQRAKSAVAGLRVELPVFNGFAREARVQQAQATLGQARSRLEQLRQEAMREVHGLVADVREARLRAQGQERAVQQARRGFEIASAEYRAGLGSQLQVTDAEVALRQAEFNYARSVYDFLVASARLDNAVGNVPDQISSFVLPD
ncbi:MAG TPA: TolC family protein [Gemmatimonadales bacterium]|nr:TolC family protein [Gemmatimonadales bacterium]